MARAAPSACFPAARDSRVRVRAPAAQELHDLGFPRAGTWREIFNSDVYEQFPNPAVAGNGGAITVDGGPLHDLPNSASIVIPANSILIFAAT
jgi:1,4-alpha-glucan branching enzyme